MKISTKVQNLEGTFSIQMLRLTTRHQTLTNALWSDVMKAVKTLQPHEADSLPNDHKGLLKAIPLQALSCWLGHVCFDCNLSILYKYHWASRDVIPFKKCHKILDYNSDHFLLTDLSEVLALALPSIWSHRHEKYVPPHIANVMKTNKMDLHNDVTLTVSSDEVQYFKTSALSISPLMGFVDGIPYHLQRKSVLFLGALACRDKGKYFQLNLMIEEFVKQVNRLNNVGFEWLYDGQVIKTRVLISRVVADSPARAALQGMSNSNGMYGCNYCFQCQVGHYFTHFSYELTLRTDRRMREIYAADNFDSTHMNDAFGAKWESKFAKLPFDVIDGFPPDGMHAVYLGVTKLLISYWVSKNPPLPDGKRQPKSKYQLHGHDVTKLDEMLLGILPPERTSRRPREISKFATWKAHEFSMFLLYYGPVILQDILPPDYYNHYVDLVLGISLLSRRITAENMKKAEEHLNRFSSNMVALYPKTSQRFNVHLLRHLPRFCGLHGILPLFSMTIFESHNHKLGRYIHGTQAVTLQMYQKSTQSLILNCQKDKFDKQANPEGRFEYKCSFLSRNCLEIRNFDMCYPDTTYHQVYYPPGGKPRIVLQSYTALTQSKSLFVMLDRGTIGCIKYFFYGFFDKAMKAGVEEYLVTNHEHVDHIYFFDKNLGQCVVPVTAFKEQVIEVKCGNKVAYALYLNNIEHVGE